MVILTHSRICEILNLFSECEDNSVHAASRCSDTAIAIRRGPLRNSSESGVEKVKCVFVCVRAT